MNGTTGRLYKSLVLDQQVANSAFARHEGMKYEGFFEFRGVAKPGKTPEQVEQAIYKEIEKLQNEPVPDRELQKVKNEQAASNFRAPAVRLLADAAVADATTPTVAGRPSTPIRKLLPPSPPRTSSAWRESISRRRTGTC